MNDEQLEELWIDFGDIPINDDEEIDAEFITDGIVWPVGTDRFEIWHWFDDRVEGGVAHLMGLVDKNTVSSDDYEKQEFNTREVKE